MKKFENFKNKKTQQVGYAYKLDKALTLQREIMAFIYKNKENKTITRFVDEVEFNEQYEPIN